MKTLGAPMRAWLWFDAFLVFVTGVQCFVLAERTADFFAWTVNPPLTAAFLGACYWAALPLVALSAREPAWARARVAVFGVLIFTATTTVATLLHLDRFHFDSPDLLPKLAAWAWMAVYAVVPPSLLVLILLQERMPGADPPRTAPLPSWMRLCLGAQGGGLVVVGVLLFLSPEVGWWPWPLSALTGRAIGAWPLGIGVTVLHAVRENDWYRLRALAVSYLLLGVLLLANLARFRDTVEWEGASAALYTLVVAAIAGVGGYATWRAWRPRSTNGARSAPGSF
jgi:hypothetical protein